MDKKLQTSNHIIAYIDILGYVQMINEFKTEDMFLEFIDEALNSALMISGLYNTDCVIKKNIFSDNIVFAIEVDDKNLKELRHKLDFMLNYVSLIQSTLSIHYTVYIRGGITLGSLYIDNQMGYVFGKGLIKSYNMENNLAKYPRILIDDLLIDIIIKDKDLCRFIYQDYDKLYFLNYLEYFRTLLTDRLWNDVISPEVLSEVYNHKRAIIHSIKTFYNNDKIMEKYKWIVRYHNGFCKILNLDKIKDEKYNFLISKDVLDWTFIE